MSSVPMKSPRCIPWRMSTTRTARNSDTCPTRRSTSWRWRPLIARKIHAIRTAPVQGDRARLRRHAVERHLRRGRPAGGGDRRAAARAAGVHGGAAAGEGMLLALCSKNNEEDVAETFRAHPDMPLQLDDFAASRVNWRVQGRQPGGTGGGTRPGAGSASCWWTITPRSATRRGRARRRCSALALPAEAGGDARISAARVGFRPRAGDRGRPAAARVVRAAGGTGAGGARRGQPGGVSGGR